MNMILVVNKHYINGSTMNGDNSAKNCEFKFAAPKKKMNIGKRESTLLWTLNFDPK